MIEDRILRREIVRTDDDGTIHKSFETARVQLRWLGGKPVSSRYWAWELLEPHMHAAGVSGDMDACDICGQDFRNEIHVRLVPAESNREAVPS